MNSLKNKKLVKGQGALEYLLLIGGAVLVATIVLITILGTAGSTNTIISNNISTYQTHINLGAGGGANLCGTGGQVCASGSSQACVSGNYPGNQTCNSNCSGYNSCVATESCGDGIINGITTEVCDTLGDIGCSGGQTCNAGCGGCSAGPTMAASFAMDFTTMNPVIFAPVSNSTRTENVAFTNSSAGNLNVTGFTATFSAGTALTDISIGGVSVWSGSAATATPTVASFNIAPGTTYATFTFSSAAHQATTANTFNIVFDYSDTSQYTSQTLSEVVALAGPLSGSCTGTTFNDDSTLPLVSTGAMVTDKGLSTNVDYGLVGDWSITAPPGATAVAFASLRVRVQSVANSGTTPVSMTEYIIPNVTSCVAAGLDDNTDDTSPPGTPIGILPADVAVATHTFDVASYVPAGGGTFQYIMTGQDVSMTNDGFRSYLTDQGANPPVLLVGFIV